MPTWGTLPTGPGVYGQPPGSGYGFPVMSPGAVNFYGHSYVSTDGSGVGDFTGFGLFDLDQALMRLTLAALGTPENKAYNFAQAGSVLVNDNTVTNGSGGHVNVLQSFSPLNVRQALSTKAPWTNSWGLSILGWGINDINTYGGGSESQRYKKLWQEALRTSISRLRSGAVYESIVDTNTTYSGGGLGGAHWSSVAATNVNSGAGFARTATVGATATLAIPSDYDGEVIAIGFIGRKGLTGGQATVTIDGVIVDRINTSSVTADSLNRGGTAVTGLSIVLTRRYKVTKATAHTIVITTTGIDGNFDYNYYQFEAADANPIIVCGINKIRSYLAGLLSSGDQWVDEWNQATLQTMSEFPGPIEYADFDDAINQSQSGNLAFNNGRICADGTHPSESGYRWLAATILDAWMRICRKTDNPISLVTPNRDSIGGGVAYPTSGPIPANYLLPMGVPSGTVALTIGSMYAIPYVITRGCTLRNVTFDGFTVAGGGGLLRLGLMYDHVSSGVIQVQGAGFKMYDWGTFAATVASPKSFAIPAGQQRVPLPGIYWLVIIPQAGVTDTANAITGPNPLINNLGFLGTQRPIMGSGIIYTVGGGFTTIPNFVPLATHTLTTSASMPFAGIEVASIP